MNTSTNQNPNHPNYYYNQSIDALEQRDWHTPGSWHWNLHNEYHWMYLILWASSTLGE